MDRSLEPTHPTFAVVGYPNKGKSTIVSSLAMDDSIAISNVPGTTTKRRSFPLQVDGKILYELIDTPGFQRARELLAWLQSHDVGAHKRHEVVRKFLQEHRNNERFHDEIELLTPIMEGAGIIYVVDASKPYGQEYEAQMEILRWTGQPSMALMNKIDEGDYSQEWRQALSGYFQIIRSYDPMRTDLAQYRAILESMAQLNEAWTAEVKASLAHFEAYHERLIERSALVIAQTMLSALQHIQKAPLLTDEPDEATTQRAQEAYKKALRQKEREAQRQIEAIWHHRHVEKEQQEMDFQGVDLFSKASADIFGLSRKELMVTAATTGAVTGAGVDLLFAGHTLLLGGVIGAVVGGVGAYLGFNELSEVKILGGKLGRRYWQIGPMKNRNFPYIQLGRLLYYTHHIASLSHAKRQKLTLAMDESFKQMWLTSKRHKTLEKLHEQIRDERMDEAQIITAYKAVVEEILKSLLKESVA